MAGNATGLQCLFRIKACAQTKRHGPLAQLLGAVKLNSALLVVNLEHVTVRRSRSVAPNWVDIFLPLLRHIEADGDMADAKITNCAEGRGAELDKGSRNTCSHGCA